MKILRLAPRGVIPALLLSMLPAMSLPNGLSAQEPRLSNLSARAPVGTGAGVLSAGFFIAPGADKKMLIRAIGPTLGIAPFNLAGTLPDPTLTLFNSANAPILTNDNWGTPVGAGAADAATITATGTSVGAFALPAGSRDSVILATLAPGKYTVQVSGVGGGTGLAIVELYEVGGTGAKLVNISALAQAGTGANAMFPGIFIAPGTGKRRLLVRAVGPTLSVFGVTPTLADPTLTVINAGGTAAFSATNNDWGTPVGTTAASAATLSAAFTEAGAFALPAGSKDAAVLVDLPAGNYTAQIGGGTGFAIVEVYDLTPAAAPVVTISATKPTADESGSNPGEFTVTRTGTTIFPLTVTYGVGGSAVNGFDYPALFGTVTIPAGAESVKIPLVPNPDVQSEGLDTVVITLTAATATNVGNTYTIGTQNTATVTIADSPATLYVASIRPTSGAPSSTAYGTATILLSASGTLAGVNISFSNLSSAEVTAHLTLGPTEDFVYNLPQGQVTGAQWTFAPTGTYNSTALLNALKSGTISVRIDTANYPNGEVKGTFVAGTGSQTFSPPSAPPAVSLTGVTATDAARFLAQTTFGPKKSEIDALAGGSIAAWIDSQIALPFTSHRAATIADRTTYGGSPSITNWNAIHLPNRQNAWFKTVLTAPDQLRQRVAFALSEIFVTSDVSLGDDSRTEPLANYYDLLGNGAFGNFRTLLENVTLSPVMGEYLSSLRNSKADPVTGQMPDENYAREVMQLFTIGLQLLQPDGTLVLGTDGLPIATYNQTTISEMAKVFTGWA